MMRQIRSQLTVLIVLLTLLPATAGATTYTIKEFTQVKGTTPTPTTFFDPFNGTGGTPPPAGPSGAATYGVEGTFLPANEHDGVLDLVTGQGLVFPGDDERVISATVGVTSFFFTSGITGSVEGLFVNIAPLPGEGYGIGIIPNGPIDDEALLIVFNSGGNLAVVFLDEGPNPVGTFSLTGLLTGSGEIGLRLAMSASGGATGFVDRDGSGTTYVFENLFGSATTSLALGTDTHTGGFAAFEPVPEPATLMLLGSGLLGGLAARARRKRRASLSGQREAKIASAGVSTLITLLVTFLLAAPVPASGTTVAYWRFEEGAGTSFADSSGNAHNGTAQGSGVAFSTDVPLSPIPATGASNQFSLFFFASTTNGVGVVPDSPSLRPSTGVTIEAWVKPDSSARVIVGKQLGGISDNSFQLELNPFRFQLTNPTGMEVFAGGSSAPPSGVWSHVAGSWDGATMRLYLNGLLVGSNAFAGPIGYDANPVLIGLDDDGFGVPPSGTGNAPFRGFLDEIRISDMALGPSEFLAAPVPEPGTLLLLSSGLLGSAMWGRRRRTK